MLGVSRQTKTARHDRHAVEQDAVERRIGIRKYLAPGHKRSYVYDYRTHLLIIVLLIKVNARERRHANCRSHLYAVACPRPCRTARLRAARVAFRRRRGAARRPDGTRVVTGQGVSVRVNL